MEREHALEAIKLRMEIPEHVIHSLAVEAVMRELASHLHDDVDQWGIAGLVHDIDLERVNKNTQPPGLMAGDILEGLDFDETIIWTVKSQNPNNNIPRRRRIDKALFFASPMCLFVAECVKSVPDPDIDAVDRNLIIQRLKQADFAPELSRERIENCSELGISMDLLIDIALKAFKEAELEMK